MSRSPSEGEGPGRVGLADRFGGARAAVRYRWLGARGRLPRHLLYVHAHGVVGWRLDREVPPETADTVAAWCAAHPGSELRLRLSGELVHSLVVDPALELRGAASVRRYAKQQFTHYHGLEAALWPLTVWNEPGQSGACAAHAVDLDAIRAETRRHGVRMRYVAPAWSAGLRSLSAARPAFAGPGRHGLLLIEAGVATWLVADDGRVVTLSQRYLDVTRANAAEALLESLVLENAALAEPPIVIGGRDPDGAPTLADWLLDRVAA